MMNIQEHRIKNVEIWYPTRISKILKVIKNVISLSGRQKKKRRYPYLTDFPKKWYPPNIGWNPIQLNMLFLAHPSNFVLALTRPTHFLFLHFLLLLLFLCWPPSPTFQGALNTPTELCPGACFSCLLAHVFSPAWFCIKPRSTVLHVVLFSKLRTMSIFFILEVLHELYSLALLRLSRFEIWTSQA